MYYLLEIFGHYPLVSLLQTAFMVWMLVDCYRRGADWYWYWVIFFLPVIGSWVYFFAVKVPAGDFRNLSLGGAFRRGPSLDQLRYLADQTPTLINHLTLAQRLIEVGQPAEAVPHLEAVLKTEPDHGYRPVRSTGWPPVTWNLGPAGRGRAGAGEAAAYYATTAGGTTPAGGCW